MKAFVYIAALFTFTPALLTAEEKISFEALPPAVQATVKRESEGATIKSIIKEKEHGKTNYEIESMRNGKSHNLDVSPDGTLSEVEDEVDLSSIPTAARAAFEQKAAGGSVQIVEKVTGKASPYYEAVILSKTGKKLEAAVNADGTAHH